MNDFLLTLSVFIATIVLIPIAARLAKNLGLMDHPDHNGRKHHEEPTPRIGGLVVFALAIPAMFFANFINIPTVIGAIILMLTGLLDDRFDTIPLFKFAGQIIAATIVVIFGNVVVYSLGVITAGVSLNLGIFAVPFSILCIVLLINAMNMIDGLDGLCAGIGAIMLLFLHAPAVLIAAIFGFLVYNLRTPLTKRAVVFFGDTGSMTLGLMLGVFAISSAQNMHLEPMTIAWVLAVPIMDACAIFIRRAAQKKSPFSADRGHIHYRLMERGFSHMQAVYGVFALSALFATIGFLPIPQLVSAILWSCILITHVFLSLHNRH